MHSCIANSSAWRIASSLEMLSRENILSIWAPTCAIATPIALATSQCSGLIISLQPFNELGMIILPPPTKIKGASPASVLILSMLTSTNSLILSKALSIRLLLRFSILSRFPNFVKLHATATSVVVKTLPPKTRASLATL